MPSRTSRAPESRAGAFGWSASREGAEIRFLGRGLPREREAPLPAAWLDERVERARLLQVHGDTVCEARPGPCGEGDALVTSRRGLALEIASADCVPILFAGDGRIAAAHAGWRGIAGGVVRAALSRLGETRSLSAWIGPAIGPCCYEVEESVARAVAAACPGTDPIAGRSERGRPRLDLALAVVGQLRAAGVARIESLGVCTRCRDAWLWSYRRDGALAGRNLALVWLT